MNKKSLVEAFPELVKQWHPTKNDKFTPNNVTPGSGKKVWWICPNNPEHEWLTRVNNRTKGRGCPYCAGKRKFGYKYRFLAEAYPELAKEWHTIKNGDLTPDNVTEGSNRSVWWICSNDPSHEWQTKVQRRSQGNGKCPKCSGKSPSKKTSLVTKYPHIAKQWHTLKNADLTPHDVFPSSSKRVWWQCNVNPKHEWQAKISSRIQTSGKCKYCINKRVRLPVLAEYDPVLAGEWHSKKNKGLTANDVTAGSAKKVWWQCKNDPEHVWKAAICNRTRGRGCPICGGKVAGNRNLALLYPNISKEWHPTKNGILKPEDVTTSSNKKVWWLCSVDQKHEWVAFISSRTKRGTGKCPKCTRLEKKSFAEVYPDVAKEWHPTKNGKLEPADIPQSSSKKYWWQCSINQEHVWKATIQNRGINQSGCPICFHEKASQELTDYLVETVKANSEFYQNFLIGIQNVNKLSEVELEDNNLEQTLLRLLFANTITLMETYLSDAFTNTVIGTPELVRKLLETSPYFEQQKFKVSNLFTSMDKLDMEITKYLQDEITYHNIWKVRSMYESVLGLEFPEDLSTVQKAIMARHDIVHRNGKTKDGNLTCLSKIDINQVTSDIIKFISSVEKQLQGFLTPSTGSDKLNGQGVAGKGNR